MWDTILPIVTPESKNAQVVRQVSALILSGKLKNQELLPAESELCERLDVSRSILRESMKILASKGLVRIQQGHGTVVTRPTANVASEALRNYMQLNELNLHRILEVRSPIEIAVAGIAAARRSEEQLCDLATTVEAMRNPHATLQEQVRLDHVFHHRLFQTTDNPLFSILLDAMEVFFARLREETAHFGIEKVIRQHGAVVDAVRAGDAEAAAQAMDDHMQDTTRDLDQLLSEGGS